jgi:hypothetical protein
MMDEILWRKYVQLAPTFDDASPASVPHALTRAGLLLGDDAPQTCRQALGAYCDMCLDCIT